MELVELENQYRVYLYPYEYDTLLENSKSQATRIVMRLGAEVGLRISEIEKMKFQHIRPLKRNDASVSFLYVPEFRDEPDKYEKGRPRMVVLPRNIEQEILDYMEDEGKADSDMVFSVVKRTLQDWVKRSAEQTAEVTGNDDFRKVSIGDLRATFARDMVERHRVHPGVVQKMGGWEYYRSLEKYLSDPDEDLIIEEYQAAGLID